MTTLWMTLAVVPMLLPLSRMLRFGPPLTKISNLALILFVENHSASGYSSLSCLYSLQLMIPSFPSSSLFSYESVEQLSFLQAVSPFSRVMLLILISGSASAFSSLIVILGSMEFMILMHCNSKLGYRLANLPFFAMFTIYSLTISLICLRAGSSLALEKTTCPDFCASTACWSTFSNNAQSASFLPISMGISWADLVQVVIAATSAQLSTLLTLRQLVLSLTPRKYLLASLIFSTKTDRLSRLFYRVCFSCLGENLRSDLVMGSVMLSALLKNGVEKAQAGRRWRQALFLTI